MMSSVLWFLFSLLSAFNLNASNTSEASAADPGPGLTRLNETLNETLQEQSSLSELFGFIDISGVRVFSPEQEAEGRIMGGEEAWSNSWPWTVSLFLGESAACGGAVLGPTWVLSAAHCFNRHNKASRWTVLAGKHDLENHHEPRQQLVSVLSISVHPAYSPRTKQSDVALLQLDPPLRFTQHVRPIAPWTGPLPTREQCTVTGWGTTRENGPRSPRLQEVNVTVLSPDVCSASYAGRIRPEMFCAGRERGGADACQGDSGGPLSCLAGSRFRLAGVVSWGIGCGRSGRPGVYTKVQLHTQWILDTMNQPNVTEDEQQVDEEEQCGVQSSSSLKAPGVASLSVAQDGALSVGNVSEATPFLWPWQVSLQTDGKHYCSGTLIAERWVVTAKHCSVRPDGDMAVLGLHDLRFSSAQSLPVEESFSVGSSRSFPPEDNLVLLRLGGKARLNSQVFPVCLPDEDEELDSSWSCVTTGWGVTTATAHTDPDRMHHVSLSLVNETMCNRKWNGLTGQSHICSDNAGSASCLGDHGAPLFCRKRGAYFLFGLVTWGSSRCRGDRPAVWTRVSDYESWISNVTKL